MNKEIIYWTTKNGKKIDIDKMDVNHLRNTLKMIVKNQQSFGTLPININNAISFQDKELYELTNKSQYQIENEENIWK